MCAATERVRQLRQDVPLELSAAMLHELANCRPESICAPTSSNLAAAEGEAVAAKSWQNNNLRTHFSILIPTVATPCAALAVLVQLPGSKLQMLGNRKVVLGLKRIPYKFSPELNTLNLQQNAYSAKVQRELRRHCVLVSALHGTF